MTPRDHDWEIIARRDPHFGVLSASEFRTGQVDENRRQEFYRSGCQTVEEVLSWFDADLGARPSGRALDIGCGLGRLSCALAGSMQEVVGYDISETMVGMARQVAPANASFTTTLPTGPFDWFLSFIVFQHIPPAEGLALLEACLERAAPGALVSLQFTAWNDHPRPKKHWAARALRWWQHVQGRSSGVIDPLIRMHDYNLSDGVAKLTAAGFERLVLRHTDHGGHHGVWVLGRRSR